MKKIFITYGDTKFEFAKKRIVAQAKQTGEFDEIKAYNEKDLSQELLNSGLLEIKRGGGLWSWKPDIILSTIESSEDGDIIVYADAGCTLNKSKEWKKYWRLLDEGDILPMRIFKKNYHWTRKEVFNYFGENSKEWYKLNQFEATVVILKVSPFTRSLIKEWRDIIINNPNLIKDVIPDELPYQHQGFIENRHDQSIYSSLIYHNLIAKPKECSIKPMWEHVEDFDMFRHQAIRATRLRDDQGESPHSKIKSGIKRLIKDLIIKPWHILNVKKQVEYSEF